VSRLHRRVVRPVLREEVVIARHLRVTVNTRETENQCCANAHPDPDTVYRNQCEYMRIRNTTENYSKNNSDKESLSRSFLRRVRVSWLLRCIGFVAHFMIYDRDLGFRVLS
jgi:hypothetical protein